MCRTVHLFDTIFSCTTYLLPFFFVFGKSQDGFCTIRRRAGNTRCLKFGFASSVVENTIRVLEETKKTKVFFECAVNHYGTPHHFLYLKSRELVESVHKKKGVCKRMDCSTKKKRG